MYLHSVSVFSSPVRKYRKSYIAVTPASALALASALLKMFLVKVLMSLYLLKLWMDQVDTLHVCRCWSEVLCCTIMTPLGDLEVKVKDLEICMPPTSKKLRWHIGLGLSVLSVSQSVCDA